MVRAIVFDCFGVLASDGWLPFKRKYFSHDHDLMEQASDLNKQVDSGLADYDEFIAAVAKMAQISPANARQQIEQNPAHDELFAYIKHELKPQYKIGFLSNAGANWLPELFTSEQVALFDAIYLSYQTGITKPDARAYHITADRLQVPIESCVFIDDQERFITGATEAGMQAVLFTSLPQLQADLQGILSSKG